MKIDTKKYQNFPIKQFVDQGWLQEVNRLFFHPAGLALTVKRNPEGEYILGEILDCRHDPAKLLISGSSSEMIKKGIMVSQSVQSSATARVETLGFDIQPMRTSNQPQLNITDQELREK